jgi:hypothetical protein
VFFAVWILHLYLNPKLTLILPQHINNELNVFGHVDTEKLRSLVNFIAINFCRKAFVF